MSTDKHSRQPAAGRAGNWSYNLSNRCLLRPSLQPPGSIYSTVRLDWY